MSAQQIFRSLAVLMSVVLMLLPAEVHASSIGPTDSALLESLSAPVEMRFTVLCRRSLAPLQGFQFQKGEMDRLDQMAMSKSSLGVYFAQLLQAQMDS